MKCKYDELFIQKYNDVELSIEEKSEFEKHLISCSECSGSVSNDRALLSYLVEENVVEEPPVTSIISHINLNKYKDNSMKYKIKSFLYGFFPMKKIIIPVIALSLIFIVIASNPLLSNYLMDSVANVLNKGDRIKSQYVKEISIEEVDNGTVELKGDALIEKLNQDGIGVSTWNVSYADKDKIFFRNYSTLVGYKNKYIYRVADLKAMDAHHVQGTVVSEFKFSLDGKYVAIGNFNSEEDTVHEYKGSIYMLDTDTGKYFIIGDGNFANITDKWSYNGRYYVFADKNTTSVIRLFDTHVNKLYEIKNPGGSVENIFVTDGGGISLYTSGYIYFLTEKDYQVENKTAVNFKPLFIDAQSKTAITLKDGNIEKYYIKKDKVEIKEYSTNKQNSDSIDDNNIYIDQNRFIVFKVSDEIKAYDIKEDRFNSFSPKKLPFDGNISSLKISPEGKWIFFNELKSINYFGKNIAGEIEVSEFMYPTWMSDSKIVFINPFTEDGLEYQAGKFEITSYDVISKVKNVIYTSVNKTVKEKTDVIAYFINSTKPIDLTSYISPEEPIIVKFNVDMDESTLKRENISVLNDTRKKDITDKYTFRYDKAKKELVITPKEQLSDLKTNDYIKVMLKAQIKDLKGNFFPNEYSFSFWIEQSNIFGRDLIQEDLKDTVVISDCKVKSGPGEEYDDIESIKYGETIYIRGRYKDWYLAMSDTIGEFWIAGKNLIAYNYDKSAREIGIITADSVEIGKAEVDLLRGNLVWVIKRDEENSFVRPVSIDIPAGYSGWISNKKYTLNYEGTYFNQCFVKSGAQIYKEPDEISEVIGEAGMAGLDNFCVITKNNNKGWFYVEIIDPMQSGWVKEADTYLRDIGTGPLSRFSKKTHP